MGMITYDVRSTVSRYSSCSEHSTTIHAFRSATNEGISSRPMNDIRVLNLKQTKMTYFVVVVFFTLTDRASTIPSNIRGCQSGTWSQRGTKVNGSHHGDNPRYSDQQGSKSRQKVMRLYRRWHRPISKRFIKPPYSIHREHITMLLINREGARR